MLFISTSEDHRLYKTKSSQRNTSPFFLIFNSTSEDHRLYKTQSSRRNSSPFLLIFNSISEDHRLYKTQSSRRNSSPLPLIFNSTSEDYRLLVYKTQSPTQYNYKSVLPAQLQKIIDCIKHNFPVQYESVSSGYHSLPRRSWICLGVPPSSSNLPNTKASLN